MPCTAGFTQNSHFMSRPLFVDVFPHAIEHNIRLLKAKRAQSHLIAVVKANAYGHGLSKVLSGLNAADSLGLLEIEGAALLRQLGWKKPILLLEGAFGHDDLAQAAHLSCDLVLHSDSQLDLLASQIVSFAGRYRPRLYLKVNTGMNRLGFAPEDVQSGIRKINALVSQYELPPPVLMTHFANADDDTETCKPVTTRVQHDMLMALKPNDWLSSLGNSAATLNHNHLAGDFVRPGIALYGSSPGPLTATEYGLRPALNFESEIIAVQSVKAGQWVGYGSRWCAPVDSRIGVVACGYADGYPRHAPDGTPVAVAGEITQLVGRISMDMLTVDISHIPAAGVGARVQLWGDIVSVDAVAKASGTIGYELLCATMSRHIR